MSDKQQLSALMDGEESEQALLKSLADEQENLRAWRSYHLIGDTLRGEHSATGQWDIASRVALALENEAPHQANETEAPATADNVTVLLEAQPRPKRARAQMPLWLSSLTQVGIAACVSLLVVFSVQHYSGNSATPSSSGDVPVLQTIPLAGSAEPVSLTRESVDPQSEEAKKMEQRRHLNALMQDYELQLRLNGNH